MTATELYNLVKDWPREARPKNLARDNTPVACWWNDEDDCYVSDDHAVLLFEASAARWLTELGYFVECWKENDGTYRVFITTLMPGCVEDTFAAPTLFLALHAAILAAKENA